MNEAKGQPYQSAALWDTLHTSSSTHSNCSEHEHEHEEFSSWLYLLYCLLIINISPQTPPNRPCVSFWVCDSTQHCFDWICSKGFSESVLSLSRCPICAVVQASFSPHNWCHVKSGWTDDSRQLVLEHTEPNTHQHHIYPCLHVHTEDFNFHHRSLTASVEVPHSGVMNHMSR